MVRSAEIKDINQINSLGILVNENFEKLFDIKKILSEKFSVIYVYELDSKIVGFLHATNLYEAVDIINVVVDTEFRRQNVASTLLDYMFSDLNESAKIYTLEVSTKNTAAINLYKKFGFEVVNTRNGYYEGIDAYLMSREV